MLAQQISAWRQVRGLTQEELALRTGIPRPNLSAIERGQHDVTVATLEKIARALDLRPGQLLDEAPAIASLSSRHEADALAAAVVNGERSFTPEKNRLADDIASQIINLLEAHHAPGFRRVSRRSRLNSHRRLINNKIYGPETINRILARIPKHLP